MLKILNILRRILILWIAWKINMRRFRIVRKVLLGIMILLRKNLMFSILIRSCRRLFCKIRSKIIGRRIKIFRLLMSSKMLILPYLCTSSPSLLSRPYLFLSGFLVSLILVYSINPLAWLIELVAFLLSWLLLWPSFQSSDLNFLRIRKLQLWKSSFTSKF